MIRAPAGRTALGLLFIVTGVLHFTRPAAYVGIMPGYLPAPDLLVAVSGAAEIAGGVGLLIPALRSAAGIGLILLLVAVFPANVEMLRQYREHGVVWWGEALLWLRLPLQAVLIWWVWRVSRKRTAFGAPAH